MKNTKIKTPKFYLCSLILLHLFCSTLILFAQEITSSTEISWEKGEILISAKTPIPNKDKNLTAVRLELAEYIDRELTEIVLSSFSEIYLDSINTLKNGFTENIDRLIDFDAMNLKKSRTSSSMSRELDYVENFYIYNIYQEIIPLLISHEKGATIPVELNYTATAKFSGIVIYAGDELPYYGENKQGKLQPSIFPEIFNKDMLSIASVSMVDSDYLCKWGMIQYTKDFDEKRFEHRIGIYPLRLTAEAIFGNNHTDLVISKEAASKILFLEENRKLIKEGRILIILAE